LDLISGFFKWPQFLGFSHRVGKNVITENAIRTKVIGPYLDLISGGASAQRRPSSLAISPTVNSGLAARTFGRTSFENQKKADLEIRLTIS
jgi:hypothetical protein